MIFKLKFHHRKLNQPEKLGASIDGISKRIGKREELKGFTPVFKVKRTSLDMVRNLATVKIKFIEV